MPNANDYSSLRRHVAEAGGMRLAVHSRLRDRLVDWAVEEFPTDAPDDKGASVLAARLRRRVRESNHGSILAMALVSIIANLIARLVWEWWKERHSHRVLMAGWQKNAQKGRDV